MATEKTASSAKEKKIANDPYEMVTINVPRVKGAGRGMYVSVNGNSWFVPWGKKQEVPRYVAEVIENSIEQDERTAEMIEEHETRFIGKEKKLYR